MRAGFRRAWADNDFATTVALAEKLPESAPQEGDKLSMWYENT